MTHSRVSIIVNCHPSVEELLLKRLLAIVTKDFVNSAKIEAYRVSRLEVWDDAE